MEDVGSMCVDLEPHLVRQRILRPAIFKHTKDDASKMQSTSKNAIDNHLEQRLASPSAQGRSPEAMIPE